MRGAEKRGEMMMDGWMDGCVDGWMDGWRKSCWKMRAEMESTCEAREPGLLSPCFPFPSKAFWLDLAFASVPRCQDAWGCGVK